VWKGSVFKLIYHNIILFLIPYTLLRKASASFASASPEPVFVNA
jgi:hypothetical protein